MSTDKRQLRITISGILEAHAIDNMALEIKLTEAVTKFFALVDEQKKDPVKVRKDILAGMLEYQDKYSQFEKMQERIEKATGVTPDGSDEWNRVVRFCLAKCAEAINEPVEKYGEWMRRDVFNSPKVHQIAMKPGLIVTTWSSAFSGVTKSAANKPNRAPMQG